MLPQIITEQDIVAALRFDESVITAVEEAFASLANGSEVVMPPVMQINVDQWHGQACIKSAWNVGAPYFVVKLASTWHDNLRRQLPNNSGLMLVCNSQTGYVETILLDNGYLTALRTQAAGAVAAKYLSRADSSVAGIIGAGRQAKLQLVALLSVRPVTLCRVWSPNHQQAQDFAREMSEKTGIRVEAVTQAEQAVRHADIVVTATPAREPIVRPEWIAAGQHITAMGADAPGKSELFPGVLAKADCYVADYEKQCRALSELHSALQAGAITEDFRVRELGDIVAGVAQGRQSDRCITIADLTGLGVQDTAIALLARATITRE